MSSDAELPIAGSQNPGVSPFPNTDSVCVSSIISSISPTLLLCDECMPSTQPSTSELPSNTSSQPSTSELPSTSDLPTVTLPSSPELSPSITDLCLSEEEVGEILSTHKEALDAFFNEYCGD